MNSIWNSTKVIFVVVLLILSTLSLVSHPAFILLIIGVVAMIYNKTKRLLPKQKRRFTS